MNILFKKTAAVLTAAVMMTAALGTEAFAAGDTYTEYSVTVANKATVAKPKIAIKGTLGKRKVLLSTSTSGATIYYTTNGTTPTINSKKYKNGTLIQFTKNTTIKAIAVKGSAKSAVMTKAVRVTRLYGDVNGDGKVNQSDYTRLRNYIEKKTTYICKDNADTNGSNGLSSKDLEVLSMYLNGTVKTLPYKASTSLKTPVITVYSAIGCKNVEFTSSQSGVSFYYTTNGTTPTTSSKKYTGKFPLYTSSTVKVIAYKDGISSSVKSVDVKISACAAVQATPSASQTYDNNVQVQLSCATPDAKIYYTTDGTDPRTSNTARLFYSSVNLTKTTTLKAFAQAKGYSDGEVSSFNYTVNENSGFEISGYVWNDTPAGTNTPNGVRASNEPGIGGITVSLINTVTNKVDKTTTTLADGSYSFTNLERGMSYKVEFKYNYQKYRAYTAEVLNGNQALAPQGSIPGLTIKNSGTYETTTNKLAVNCNSYALAVSNAYFTAIATSTLTFTNSATNVNLALQTNCYGTLGLTVTATGQDTAKSTIANNSSINYNISLSNNSPTEALRDVAIDVYLTNAFSDVSFTAPLNGTTFNQSFIGTTNGYNHYLITGLLTSDLAAGSSINFGITGKVNANPDTKINCYAQVTEYYFKNSCFDNTSIPGNLSIGSVKEKDEAAAPTITVESNTAPTPVKSLNIIGTDKLKLDLDGTATGADKATYYIEIVNGNGKENLLIINNSTNIIATTQPQKATSTSGNVYTMDVTAVATGSVQFEIWLMEGNTVLQKKVIKVDVIKSTTP